MLANVSFPASSRRTIASSCEFEQRAIARLVLAQLPLCVMQTLQTPLDAGADALRPRVRWAQESEVYGEETETNAKRDKSLQRSQRTG